MISMKRCASTAPALSFASRLLWISVPIGFARERLTLAQARSTAPVSAKSHAMLTALSGGTAEQVGHCPPRSETGCLGTDADAAGDNRALHAALHRQPHCRARRCPIRMARVLIRNSGSAAIARRTITEFLDAGIGISRTHVARQERYAPGRSGR